MPARFARHGLAALLLLSSGTACRRAPEGAEAIAKRTAVAATSDSVVPVPFSAMLSEYRKLVGDSVAGFSPVFATKEALFARFDELAERGDTAALRTLALSPREFAWLYAPDARLSQPPYSMPPAAHLLFLTGASDDGMVKLANEFPKGTLHVLRHHCDRPARQEAGQTVWEYCLVDYRAGKDTATKSSLLHGAVVERGGRFKFVSLGNRL